MASKSRMAWTGVLGRGGVVAVAVLALALAACGGGGEVTSPTEATDPSDTTAPDTTAADTAPVTTEADDELVVSFPSGGPRGPVLPDPPNTPAYLLFTSGRCAELLGTIETWRGFGVDESDLRLYRGAASACTGDWDQAAQDLQVLEAIGPDFGDRCVEEPGIDAACDLCKGAVHEWLRDVVALNRRLPEATIRFAPAEGHFSCPHATTTSASPTTTTASPATTSGS